MGGGGDSAGLPEEEDDRRVPPVIDREEGKTGRLGCWAEVGCGKRRKEEKEREELGRLERKRESERGVTIVHYDLKPCNIILDSDFVDHVGDFGLARVLHQDHSNMSDKSSGCTTMRGRIGNTAPGMVQLLKFIYVFIRIFNPECGLGNKVAMLGNKVLHASYSLSL
ncbi:hypothetical protein EJB05_24857, partial [Eragrostis curvula]